jgi:nucleotide-binding universal stress UspA family protein
VDVKILVAYDGSEQARRALDWAAHMAAGSTSAVSVIGVAPTLAASPRIADAVDPSSDVDEHRRQLDEAVALLAAAGVRAETLLKVGNPAEEIITAAADGRFDAVLVGIRGMGAVKRFLIGSVADRVVRHATVPVLVVR